MAIVVRPITVQPPNGATVREQLEELLTTAGWDMEELAEHTGIPAISVLALSNGLGSKGEVTWSTRTLTFVSVALGVKLNMRPTAVFSFLTGLPDVV